MQREVIKTINKFESRNKVWIFGESNYCYDPILTHTGLETRDNIRDGQIQFNWLFDSDVDPLCTVYKSSYQSGEMCCNKRLFKYGCSENEFSFLW